VDALASILVSIATHYNDQKDQIISACQLLDTRAMQFFPSHMDDLLDFVLANNVKIYFVCFLIYNLVN
jgi:hypothetical protein